MASGLFKPPIGFSLSVVKHFAFSHSHYSSKCFLIVWMKILWVIMFLIFPPKIKNIFAQESKWSTDSQAINNISENWIHINLFLQSYQGVPTKNRNEIDLIVKDWIIQQIKKSQRWSETECSRPILGFKFEGNHSFVPCRSKLK